MKFFDIVRLSLHNMMNNKLRTLLVTSVLFILSTIIVIVVTVGVNAINIMNESMNNTEDVVADIEFEYRSGAYGDEVRYMTESELNGFRDMIYGQHPYLGGMTAEASEGNFLYIIDGAYSINTEMVDMNSTMLSGKSDYIKAGRLWNKSDENKPYIWINTLFAEISGLTVGDVVTGTIEYSNEMQQKPPVKLEFTVMGIIDYAGEYYWNESAVAVVDYKYLMNQGFQYNRIHFVSNLLHGEMDFATLLDLSGIINEYHDYDYEKNPGGLSVTSNAIDNFMYTFYLTIGIVGVVVLISLIIILLSIGCVSNSIQITVEQNAKFFGMMKAIGMRNGVVKSIVRVQALIMILIAVGLATAVTYGVLLLVEPMLLSLFNSMGAGITLSVTMPFYVPLAVFAGLAVLVVLFTIKSLNRISKMDVVSVISEVN